MKWRNNMGYQGLSGILVCVLACLSPAKAVEVSSLEELMELAAKDGREITLAPGTYRVNDYLTPERIAAVHEHAKDFEGRRPPMPVLDFSGSGNTFNLEGVILEIDTSIYPQLPQSGYHRFFFISGSRNLFRGLTIRYVGPNQGTNGNCLTLWGDGNTLEGVTLYVHGSSPYGYGDLLGKGGPNLVHLKKQSGIMVGGDNCRLKRCKVISRAFGHCFYIQGAHNTLLEDCYAEGIHRITTEMLAETAGPAFELGFESVYENRDGRCLITPCYSKALCEDGFRTYGGGGPKNQDTGKTTLINCTAVNTRAGFEICGPKAGDPTELINCTALGAERGFLLINGHIVTRRCRGDIVHGPLLYLWRGSKADVELELIGGMPETTVHALATISGTGHRIKLTRWAAAEENVPHLPILLGFGMPAHAEMSTPVLAEETSDITLINETGMRVIESDLVAECAVE